MVLHFSFHFSFTPYSTKSFVWNNGWAATKTHEGCIWENTEKGLRFRKQILVVVVEREEWENILGKGKYQHKGVK